VRRLTGHGAFESVLRHGRRVEGLYVQLIVAKAPQTGGRIGYIIGRKVSPRAVDRNRIRRKLREAVRAQGDAIGEHDVVLRVTRARSRAEQDAAALEALRLLGNLATELAR
jgi:ribonuclease P protein component